MAVSRLCQRSLSVFEPYSRLWLPVSSRCAPSQVKEQLALKSNVSLITQNLDAFSLRPIARAKQLLGGILKESKGPDIIFLQEVTSDVRTSILSNPKVREAFLVTDAGDPTSFEEVPFANMTLLSSKRFTFSLESQKDGNGVERGEKFMLGPVSCVELPSKYGRCALSVDIIPPSTSSTSTLTYRLINVHLDSLGDTLPYRIEQMEILAKLLRETGCGGGLIAGDFNAISSEDHTLLDKNGLVDAWVALYGKKGLNGATWGVGGVKRHDELEPGRLDKVAMLGVVAKDMEILPPGLIEVPKPSENSDFIPCSDHCGLSLSFTVSVLSSETMTLETLTAFKQPVVKVYSSYAIVTTFLAGIEATLLTGTPPLTPRRPAIQQLNVLLTFIALIMNISATISAVYAIQLTEALAAQALEARLE